MAVFYGTVKYSIMYYNKGRYIVLSIEAWYGSMFWYYGMVWDDREEAQRDAVVVAAPIWLLPSAKSSETTSSERSG